MRKLKLQIEDLNVVSFSTQAEETARRGTLFGHVKEAPQQTYADYCTYGNTCVSACVGAQTCWHTCGDSCACGSGGGLTIGTTCLID